MEELTAAGALVTTEVIKSLAKDMASFVKEKVSTYFTDTTNKELIDSEWAFEDYLRKVKDTYSKSKTILYRNEEKELKSFFEPPFLYKEETRIRKKPRTFFIPSESLEGIINRCKHSTILITGTGGMGKTILMKHLCVNAIETGYKIPVFVSLHWFNDMEIKDESLEELVYARLKINGFKLDYKYFQYSLEGDKYVFLLDGYDEISSEKQSIITRKIADFTKQYSSNNFIMTSRPVDRVYCWDSYWILELCPMREEQVKRLIMKLEYDETEKKNFINELDSGLFSKYKSFVSIPLTLSILYATYVENASIPETMQEFYEKSFDVLLYQHDKRKEGYERVLKSKLERHEFRRIFIRFCFETYFKDLYSFSEVRLVEHISNASRKLEKSIDPYAYKEDLVDVACMLIREGQEYVFLHRSFQEYFAAYYVSKMLDEKQTKFCSELINCRVTYKVLDFLNILKSIEPQKFDNIILLPILEKIKSCYLELDCDFISTASRYYLITTAEDSFCYALNDGLRSGNVSFEELNVLEEFLVGNPMCSKKFKDIKSFIRDNLDRFENECYEPGVPANITVVVSDIDNLSKDEQFFVYCELIIGRIILALDKCDELTLRNSGEIAFDDMVNNY